MFNCKKCRSSIEDSHRYCHGCGAYIGEPAVKADDWEQLNRNEEEEIQYEYNEDGKIVELHCDKCDAIVEKYHKYCTNCGKSLENNMRIELVEPKLLDESSIDAEGEEIGFIGKCDRKMTNLIKSFFSNKKLAAAVLLIFIFAAAGIYYYKQFNKPVAKYEQDTSYNTFVKDKDWMYYSYYWNTNAKEIKEKRGIYKIKADGSNMSKLCDSPAICMNIYKDYIYYINVDENKIYRMKKDGSDNKKVSEDAAASLLVDKGYIYYRDKAIEVDRSTLFRMKLDGTKKVELSTDALTYNILGDYIYYSSRGSLGDVYRIRTDGSGKTKVCKINGVLKYIKDDYIYYSMAKENVKNAIEFAHSDQGINKIKLDGTNSTKLSREEVYNFFIDNKDNIYYYGPHFDEKDGITSKDEYISLYKVGFSGKADTKVADKISPVFYVANDQVYYMDPNNSLLYKKDFKGSDKIPMLPIDEKSAEAFKIETIKMLTVSAEEIENLNRDIDNRNVVIFNKKGDKKVIEGYNMKILDAFIQSYKFRSNQSLQLARFIKDGSITNLDELTQIQDDGKNLMYITYKKDSKDYKVDKVILIEGVTKKEENNTIRYYLIEKSGAPEEKWLEILSINKDDIKS